MKSKKEAQVSKLILATITTLLGLFILKILPMQEFGQDILFDASAHIAFAVLILYALYFFIDQNKSWRLPYLFFSFMVLTIISLQRIIDNAHNDVGLVLGLLVGILAIFVSNFKEFKKRIEF